MNAAPSATTEEAVEHTELGLVGQLGAAAIDLMIGGRELYSVFVRTLYYTARGRREKGATLAQLHQVGNKSLFFLCTTLGFIGMILAYQTIMQTKRVVPDLTMVGATFIELFVRDLAATIGGLMLATRVGAGIAAEIGSMVVTEQVDALRMSAADPIDYLIVPRFIASMVMTIVLVVFAGAFGILCGAVTANLFFDVAFRTFFNLSLVNYSVIGLFILKCLSYGAAIPIVSGYCGLSTFGGSEGVGWATTRAVVNSSLAIIILDFFLSGAGYLLFPT